MSQDDRRPRHLHPQPNDTGTLVAFVVVFVLVLLVASLLYFGGTFALPGA